MSIISAILQGLLQGFTEFLPISSSGHLSLYQYFTGISSTGSLTFTVLLHFGTLIAVAAAFYKTIWELVKEVFRIIGDLFTGKLFRVRPTPYRRMVYMLVLSCLPLLLVLPFQKKIETLSTDNDILAEGICFLITALILTVADRAAKGHITSADQTWGSAVGIGLFQCAATLPGISRSGSTISAGLIFGLERSYAVAYSFILGIPAILGAGVLELKDAVEAGSFGMDAGTAVAGMAVAAVAGFLAIRLVDYIVRTDKFKIFAWYTFILGVIVVVLALVERSTGHMIQTAILQRIG